MDMKNIEGFKDFTNEELALIIRGFGRCTGMGIDAYDMYRKLCRYAELREKIKTKGVFIITECGQTHCIVTEQPVSEIYLDGKLVHSSSTTARIEK